MNKRSKLAIAILSATLGLTSFNTQAENLQEIYSLALENDHQIKADTAAYRAGLESKTIGRSALLPQINGSAEFSESEQTSIGFNQSTRSNTTSDTDSENETYSVSLTQPIFNMAAWYGYQQGKALSEQAEAQFNADQQSLILRVTDAYFNVLRAIDNMETAMAEEKAFGHQLEQTKQRFEVGLTAITDVHEAQSVYDDATATTFQAEGNLGIAFEELEVLTGQSFNTVSPLLDTFPVINPEPAKRSDWVDFALENNHSLKVAKFSAESARQNARAKTAGHLPTITGSYSYTDRSDTNTDVSSMGVTSPFDNRVDEGETIALSVNVPIFSGLRTSGERRQAHQQHMQSQELFNQAMRSTVQSTRSLHLSVTTGVAQVKARKQAITSSQSALEATQAGYEVGTRNLVDVLIAQRSVFTAQRNYDNTRYDYVLNMLRLKEAAGLLSSKDIQDLNQWLNSGEQISRSSFERDS